MRIDVAQRALRAGFRNEPAGTHTSKTMMLPEMRALLAAVPGRQPVAEYQREAVTENALQKRTVATRRKTLRMLRELYTLDGGVPVFAALRELWAIDVDAQPMIAALCAVARDPLLRATVPLILALPIGEPIGPAAIAEEVARAFPNRYTPGVLHHIGQNTGASWVQAGLLAGRQRKHRSRPRTTTPAVVYALYLGHLSGEAGPPLFDTLWCRILDLDGSRLRSAAQSAARSGWLDYASGGGMTEIGFRHLDELVREEAA